MHPPKYEKSQAIEGQLSRYTYIAPAGRSAAELYRNYKLEFQRLGLQTLYEKAAGARGWFGPTFDKDAEEDGLSQILGYSEADERLLVGKSKDAKPSYYVVFVTVYNDGVIPNRLRDVVQKGRALAHIIVVTPDVMQEKMTFVNADEMTKAIHDSGRIALYGIYFDTGKDELKAESEPTLAEIGKLMKGSPSMRLHVVGHTDNQGQPDFNLDLSRKRAATVVRELTGKYGMAANRLDSFGCGLVLPGCLQRGRGRTSQEPTSRAGSVVGRHGPLLGAPGLHRGVEGGDGDDHVRGHHRHRADGHSVDHPKARGPGLHAAQRRRLAEEVRAGEYRRRHPANGFEHHAAPAPTRPCRSTSCRRSASPSAPCPIRAG